MKLSDAIIKGCEGTTQGFYAQFPAPGSCCAQGAALLGAGVIEDFHLRDLTALWDTFPETLGPVPDYDGITWPAHVKNIGAAIAYLNDCERWSREEIAAWLRENGL